MQLPNQTFLGTVCKKCGQGQYTYTSDNNEWWVQCNSCLSYLFCYVPMPHQYMFHKDKHKFKMYAGGFGSAKTSTCGAEVVQHALTTPKGRTLVGAQTYAQLEETAKKQILDMIPEDFRESYLKQKNMLILKNGHEILFRSFDDETKLRSLNLTMWWIEEANTVDFEIFTQLQTRLRNHATKQHKGIMSTNPDLNWIRTEFLLKSQTIVGATENYKQEPIDINKDYATYIAATRLNYHLPKDYVQSVSRGKPEWWIRRYLEASFSHAEGMVYPMWMDNVIEPFDIQEKIKKEGWQVIAGFDFGIQDPTVMISAAIDPHEGKVYVYDEYFKTNQSVPYHAMEFKKRLDWIPLGQIIKLIADPSGAKRNINDRRSLYNHYNEYGIFFQPGDNRIEIGIQKVYSYLVSGNLKIFSSCKQLINEGINYRYKPQELDSQKNADEKPIDKDNHGLDSLRYIIQELPDDPYAMKSKGYYASRGMNTNNQKDLPFALQDNPTDLYGDSKAWMYY